MDYNEKYYILFNGSSVGLWEWDLVTKELIVNKKWMKMHEIDVLEDHIDLETWKSWIHADDRANFEKSIERLTQQKVGYFEIEFRTLVQGGDYRWMRLSGSSFVNSTGSLTRIGGSQLDITEDKAFDPVTGLPNRILLQDRTEHAFYRAKEFNEFSFSVIVFSIDRFNRLVDSLGHSIVEGIMQNLVTQLDKFRKDTDTLARLAQDEFVFLLEDTLDISELTSRISALPQFISKPIQHKDTQIVLSASIGFAIYERSYKYPMEMLKDATIAMNRVKKSGGNACQLFNHSMVDSSSELFEREMDLHVALRENQMQLYYQPIVDSHTTKARGFEALVRWNHPVKGMIHPEVFIALSEETGLIIPLGDYILEQAFKTLKDFKQLESGDLYLSVNLSAKQLVSTDLPEKIVYLQAKYDVDLAHLKLEITESVAMQNVGKTIARLNKLHDLGIGISIDDFGTGYSSLSYLKRLPITTLKIDKSFVTGIENDVENQLIVQAIIALAGKLGMNIIVEGVESKTELNTIQKWSPGQYQGYYFGKPMQKDEIALYLLDSLS